MMDSTHRPHVVVAERLEQRLGRDTFPVVHIAFGRVIAKDAVDDNADFTIIEPAVRAEPCLGGNGRGWHEEDGGNTNSKSDESFDQEEPYFR